MYENPMSKNNHHSLLRVNPSLLDNNIVDTESFISNDNVMNTFMNKTGEEDN